MVPLLCPSVPRPFALLVLLAGALLLPFAHGSDSEDAEDEKEPSLWVVEYENDIFSGEDRYYTSGVRLTRIADAREAPSWLESVARRFPGFEDAHALPYGLSIGHNIYTPADITDPEFPPDDRPYAGWLHVKFITGTKHEDGADRVRVGLGIVGPWAFGEQIQKGVHELIDTDEPRGWDTQIENEPTILLGYDRTRRLLHVGDRERWALDGNAQGGITLGNAHTHAYAGGFMRFGYNLADDFGPPRITPAASGSGYFQADTRRGWYVYFGWEGRRVVRDLFLQGNTFGGTDGVTIRRNVAEYYGGIVYTHNRLRLAYTHVWRSREFRNQLTSHDYGAFSASLWW